MKKNKILILLILAIFVFNIKLSNVFAETVVTCVYKDFFLVSLSSDGTKTGLNSSTGEKYEVLFDYNDNISPLEDMCPEKIVIDGNKIEKFIIGMSDSNNQKELISKKVEGNNSSKENVSESSDEDPDAKYELNSKKVSCGNVTDIPRKLPELTSLIVTVIQIAIPVILVIMGSLDLFKGITAGKEDEMKKGQQMFIKRLVIAAIIFFLFIIVKFIISLVVNEENEKNMLGCMKCFMYNECVEEEK